MSFNVLDVSDLNAKGVIHQVFETYRLKSCVDFKPHEGEASYIEFKKLDGYVSDPHSCEK